MWAYVRISIVIVLVGLTFPLAYAEAIPVSNVKILREASVDGAVERIASVLEKRLARRGIQTGTSQDALLIMLGRAGDGADYDAICAKQGMALPVFGETAPESYAVKTVTLDDKPAILVLGADTRGLLYGVGAVLRSFRVDAGGVVHDPLDVSTAPGFRFRGFSANQGGTMMQVTGARGWSTEQWREYVLDMALAGANCFYADGAAYDFVKSFELMTITGCRPNQFSGSPKEWKGTEFGNWVCPSVPEARAALREQWEADFKARKDHDIMRFYAGDPGGCRCEKCSPWGKMFLDLCEEYGQIWLKHHPDSLVIIANQDVTNEGDLAIFDYLNAAPRDWLYGLAYGPGSNAMSDYFRPELREDLFIYPGFGPINRYLAETLHQLPVRQKIVHYSDITHWISAQYQVEHPDPYIRAIYGRRTFHARPKAFYRIFQLIMPFSEGDVIYSEGYHDEFHQYLWNRLLWDPNRSLDDVMLEYGELHFGPDAAPLMREALYLLEDSLETPLAENPGINRYYDLVKEAGAKILPVLMERDHRWRLHMQKAALDKYYQMKVRRVYDTEARLKEITAAGAADPDTAIRAAEAVLAEYIETPEMAALREEARIMGEESAARFGVRNVGYFAVDREFRRMYQLKRMVRTASGAATTEEKRAALAELAHYEMDPRLSPVMSR